MNYNGYIDVQTVKKKRVLYGLYASCDHRTVKIALYTFGEIKEKHNIYIAQCITISRLKA